MSTTADWIIDLGPAAMAKIVAAGTPEQIAATKGSYTGHFLKPVLARGAASKRNKRVKAAE